jgi:hypothetical protein
MYQEGPMKIHARPQPTTKQKAIQKTNQTSIMKFKPTKKIKRKILLKTTLSRTSILQDREV